MPRDNRKIFLFDVDGTLTVPRGEVTSEMKAFLLKIKERVVVGLVGGSDLVKQQEQMGANITNEVDYSFSENGLVAYKHGELIGKEAIHTHLGEQNIKDIINFALHYIADLDLPIKRGTFVEFRAGMLNISPIGRNCSREERNEYERHDLENDIRKKMVAAMSEKFAHLNLKYSIGGQISFDVFPQGWDKTYSLNFLKEGEWDEIHFFGDKTFEGGNDYEIFTHTRVIGHTVTSPEDTVAQVSELLA